MSDAVFNVFPKAKYQVCLVHVGRNIAHKVRVEDRQEICEDFKTIHQATDAESAQTALQTFCDKWGKSYKKVTQGLLENPYLLTFYQFPKDIWRSIYSTNLIESFNKQIKKYTKRKEQFPNEESLERFLVTQFEDYNERFAIGVTLVLTRPVQHWQKCLKNCRIRQSKSDVLVQNLDV